MEVKKGCNFTNSFIHIHWKHKPKNIFYRIYESKVSPTRNIKAVFLHIHSRCQCHNYTPIMESGIKQSILQPAVLSQQTVSIACPEKRRRRRRSRRSRASWRAVLFVSGILRVWLMILLLISTHNIYTYLQMSKHSAYAKVLPGKNWVL